MKPLKALISLFPGGRELAESYSLRKRARYLGRLGDSERIFTHYYETNKWKDPESVSGEGSTLDNTHAIRAELPRLLERLEIDTILDAPCGDYNWFRHVPRGESLSYIGGDIVAPLVARNQERYGNDNTAFIHLDVVRDELPEADLWMCRDCFIHLSTNDIRSAVRSYLGSDIDYLLTTIHPDCTENLEIQTGDFRLLNLEKPPFSFPRAALYLDDTATGLPARVMGLWGRRELAEALTGNDFFSSR